MKDYRIWRKIREKDIVQASKANSMKAQEDK